MSGEDHSVCCGHHTAKGKQRAVETAATVTERTPLLAAPSTSSQAREDPEAPSSSAQSHRQLRKKLTSIFFISLAVCTVGFASAALLAWSYASRASSLNPDNVLHEDLVFSGPNQVNVLNVSTSGIWLNVQGKIGMDAGKAIGVDSDPLDGLFRDVWKALGRWGVRKLDKVTVQLSTIKVVPDFDLSETLIYIEMPPVEIPLTTNPPKDHSWLTPISATVHVRPTSNNTLLLRFLRESWTRGSISVRAEIQEAVIRGGTHNSDDWRRKFSGKLSNILTSVDVKLPSLPGFPHPGRNAPFPPFSQLVTLTSFSISSESDHLSLHGLATAVNPAPPSISLSLPSLPFEISIPDNADSTIPPIHVASVSTLPFALTHPNISLSIEGTVPPISTYAFPILSKFVTRYLSAQDNKILISSPNLLPDLDIQATFPAPNPRPKLLRNVTIKDMKIKPMGSAFLASGTVFARVVLPKGINVGMDVFQVLPDVLIFDGEVPPTVTPWNWPDHHRPSHGPPPETPLPDPIPERAFGHLRPEDWLPSLSVPVDPEGDDEGTAYAVSAKVVDVPMQVLPGRQKEFSDFIGKVVFGSKGATAGILGNAAVNVEIAGLPLKSGPGHKSGEIVLAGLPFQGSVHIGKKGLLRFDSDKPGQDNEKPAEDVKKEIERMEHVWKSIINKLRGKIPF
ncbi:hypothetical protein CPB83DRAFT_809476 [Crepidotus variabilis]|uniref:Uncharacterized protein n=1 Tax=Crepidotus variabilis TaxID=179855 RepID=A0A9P6JT25_9AGAR|nr:hypothetical protein CPB83DRAFT_809476 [Crepidotus variabilis]